MNDVIDRQWMNLARQVAKQSDDFDKHVGCCVVMPNGKSWIPGVNRLPMGIEHQTERVNKPGKYDWIEHAERNAIYAAARHGFKLMGATMYIPWFPCIECARAIIQAGITTLVCVEPDLTHHKWGRSHELATEMLAENPDITVRYFEESRSEQILREAG